MTCEIEIYDPFYKSAPFWQNFLDDCYKSYAMRHISMRDHVNDILLKQFGAVLVAHKANETHLSFFTEADAIYFKMVWS